MIKRTHWINRIEAAWRERNVVWLSGVRREGDLRIRMVGLHHVVDELMCADREDGR